MPGIAGIICKQPYEGVAQDVERMVSALRHGSFYRQHEYHHRDLGVYAGWTGHQTTIADSALLAEPKPAVHLILHGENFMVPGGVGDAPPSAAHHAKLAEYLVQSYEKSLDRFLEELNGWFCGLIVDRRRRRVVLFNDRYGMGRIHFHEAKEGFYFASEVKSLLRVRPELRSIRPEALAQQLRCNCVLGAGTLFKGITRLPNAAAWVFEPDRPAHRKQYFSFAEWESLPELPAEEFVQQFDTVVSRVFPKYAVGSEPVAMSLTAGLDTRVIMASLEGRPVTLPAYTFGGTWGETFDIRTARKVAGIVGQPHQTIRIDDHYFKNFADYARRSVYISDGTHEALGAHDLYFNEQARRIAPVRLTGKFGSEVVRIRRLVPYDNFAGELLQADFRGLLAQVPPPAQLSQHTHALTRVVAGDIADYEYGRVLVEQSQVTLRTPYMDNELVRLMFQSPHVLRASGSLQADYVRQHSARLNAVLTNLSRSGEGSRIKKEILFQLFRALFKAEYIYLFSAPHWLTWLDTRAERLHLERLLAGRQKFEGYRLWLRTQTADAVRQILLNPNAGLTEFFDKRAVERVVERHLRGSHNYLDELNKMLTVELIYASLLKP